MADEMDGVDLSELHQTILDKLKVQFSEFKLIEFYRSEQERKPPSIHQLPALLLELSEFGVDTDNDWGAEQLPLIARFEARVLDTFEKPQAKINIRTLATQLAYFIFKNKRFHQYAGAKAVGPACVDEITRDYFYPHLESFEVWRVDFSMQIGIGENIWKEIGQIPTPVYSYTPDVGVGHEQDYKDLDL